MDELRYPIGPFTFDETAAPGQRPAWIQAHAAAPAALQAAVQGLSDAQLDTPYRPGGWTLRQLVHHLADTHLNAYARVRLALTEDRPWVKPYDQNRWAELPDARSGPIAPSLALFQGVEERWAALLRALDPPAFGRVLLHPEQGELTIDFVVAYYAWHARHHTAQITALRRRMGW